MRLLPRGLPVFLIIFVLTSPSASAKASRSDASSLPATLNVFDERHVRSVPGLDEPLIAARSAHAENAALTRAIEQFRRQPARGKEFSDTVMPFVRFMAAHPHSAWNASINLNLGLGYYRTGRFSSAVASFQSAWNQGRTETINEVAALSDRAAGELAVMYSRVGESQKLETLLAELSDRTVQGAATELIASARESQWTFKNEPAGAFLCGPLALRNLLLALKSGDEQLATLDSIRSPQGGFSLLQVSAFAEKAQLPHRLIFRRPGAEVPVPSIVNWKVSHFAAIIEKRQDRYLVRDPTFGSGDIWVTKAAIDREATGYFLVPDAVIPSVGWRLAQTSEAASVFGKGSTAQNDTGAYSPYDRTLHNQCGDSIGMCTANAMLMLASVHLKDTPVGYRPQKGPSALVTLTYNQKEGYYPANFNFFNVGPKWSINLLSYIEHDPDDGRFYGYEKPIKRFEMGGGVLDTIWGGEIGQLNSQGVLGRERKTQFLLRRFPYSQYGPATRYEVTRHDGSVLVYATSDGATSGLRRMFLSKIVDPAGNALTLTYDASLRLTSFVDATGRQTTFSYEPNSRRIREITDPFGRSAKLEYNGANHLSAITDVLGMRSTFSYGSQQRDVPPYIPPDNIAFPPADKGYSYHSPSGYSTYGSASEALGPAIVATNRTELAITSMQTPYGTTQFSYGWDSRLNTRFLNITDPLGQKERIEFRHNAPGIPSSETDGIEMPGNPSFNRYLEMRNTFYWDKNMGPDSWQNYTVAWRTHWLHRTYRDATYQVVLGDMTSGVAESTKGPLTRRVAYFYQSGTTNLQEAGRTPFQILNSMEDGSIRYIEQQPNEAGNAIRRVDQVGRQTHYEYASNAIDLLAVRNDNGHHARYTYNDQHKPLTSTDAAGQTTTYTYNKAGQRTSRTNALGEVVQYRYDELGRITGVINANGRTQWSFTYDAFDRLATRTDSEGYLLAYGYDDLNRLTSVLYPDGTTTQITYDKLDIASIKDRLGRVTSYSYDANRQLKSKANPLGQIVTFSYFPNGALQSLTDAKGNVTQWQVDLEGRPIAKAYADRSDERYSYDSIGRLKTVVDARGVVKTYTHARDDRVTRIDYSPNANTPTVNFTYDGREPRLSSMQDALGETRFSYGALGTPDANLLIRDDGPYANDAVEYRYDSLGRMSRRTIGGSTETFEYDTLGRLRRNVNELGDFSITYLGEARQIISSLSPTVGTYWSYLDNIGDRRLSGIGHRGQARAFDYTTSPEGRLDSVREGVSASAFQDQWQYAYDAGDRLTGARAFQGGSHSYEYDAADNITLFDGAAATHNAVNQIESFDAVPHTYDTVGNLLNDGKRTYTWDGENRLIGMAYLDQPGTSSEFRYDGLGRRLAIVERSASGTGETRYLWCGGATPCQARNATDVTTGLFYQQGVAITGSSRLYYARDHLGSIREAVDSTTGAVISSYDFDPYGAQRRASLPLDFGFSGMFNHQASGLNLTFFRAYDSNSGRWLSRDPLPYAELIENGNLYSYVSGDPVNMIDPLGLWDEPVYSWNPPLLPPGIPPGSGPQATPLTGPAPVCVAPNISVYQPKKPHRPLFQPADPDSKPPDFSTPPIKYRPLGQNIVDSLNGRVDDDEAKMRNATTNSPWANTNHYGASPPRGPYPTQPLRR